MTRCLPVLAAAFAFCAMPAGAINKCVGKDGRVTYQEDKCPDDAKAGALKGSPSSPPAAPVSTGIDPFEVDSIAGAVAHMERCSALSPAYARNAARVMEEYRREHAQFFARHERSKQYQESLRERRANNAEIMKNPTIAREIAGHCGTVQPQPPANSAAAKSVNAKGLPADVDHVIDVEAAWNVCSYASRRWFDDNRPAYEAWAKRNFALTSRIHGDYDLEKEYQSRSARRTSGEPGLCANVAETLKGK
jgi:hypothetical protein